MATATMKSFLAKPGQVEKEWHLIDARDQVLGRLAVRIATILMGKHRPTYTPHTDTGDYVVVINSADVRVTGRKRQQKTYERYSGYPGGRKVIPFERRIERHPERVITEAVRRMMPKNRLARQMLRKLKVYPGPEHPHQAQNPQPLELNC